eukprot:scaffold11713_cov105-Isochrysis_galbana.AAC.3
MAQPACLARAQNSRRTPDHPILNSPTAHPVQVQRGMRMQIGRLGPMQRKKSRLAPQNIESGDREAVCAQTASRLRDDLWTYWRGSDAVPEFPLTSDQE